MDRITASEACQAEDRTLWPCRTGCARSDALRRLRTGCRGSVQGSRSGMLDSMGLTSKSEDWFSSPFRSSPYGGGGPLTGLDRSHLRRSCSSLAFRQAAAIVLHSQPLGLLHIRSRLLNFRPAMRGIFLAVDRGQMRRISIEIRSPDSKLLAVCIDPFQEAFSGNPSLRPCRAFDAYDIGGKPVAIPAAGAPAMV